MSGEQEYWCKDCGESWEVDAGLEFGGCPNCRIKTETALDKWDRITDNLFKTSNLIFIFLFGMISATVIMIVCYLLVGDK